MSRFLFALVLCASTLITAGFVSTSNALAQEFYPEDNGLATYHTSPNYRQSESHPLRVVAYVLHPVGWVLREVIFRPLSWIASSGEEVSSVMGYREPHDFRESDCFDTSTEAPDCRKISPFNYAESN